ncbi:MAG: YfiR family protein [Terricaulis sp.]
MTRWLSAALLALTMLVSSGPAHAQNAALEAAVKATFLYRFASFVEWPSGAFATPEEPIVLCVMGDRAFLGLLEEQIRGQAISGRPLTARQVANDGNITECHVLYLRGGEQATAEALRTSRSLPILTVTDADETRDLRGVIHFVIVENRVRFHIDDARAAESGLNVSSRLLNLAVSVRRRARV